MKTPDLDTNLTVIPEAVADTLTQDKATSARLCERARRHWKTNAGFRKSFARKDEREVLTMWMGHWLARPCLDLNPKLKD